MKISAVAVLALLFAGTGCRTAYYSLWEKLGKEKRDLLVDSVKATRNAQKDSAEETQDALTRLQEAYGKSGSALEQAYDRIKREYDQSTASAERLRERRQKMEQVAHDLFREWAREARSYEREDFRRKSEANLQQTEAAFDTLSRSMRTSEQRLDRVLKQFQDYVLFMKHNLNAQALNTLRSEKEDIERGVKALMEQIDASSREADAFLKDFV